MQTFRNKRTPTNAALRNQWNAYNDEDVRAALACLSPNTSLINLTFDDVVKELTKRRAIPPTDEIMAQLRGLFLREKEENKSAARKRKQAPPQNPVAKKAKKAVAKKVVTFANMSDDEQEEIQEQPVQQKPLDP